MSDEYDTIVFSFSLILFQIIIDIEICLIYSIYIYNDNICLFILFLCCLCIFHFVG